MQICSKCGDEFERTSGQAKKYTSVCLPCNRKYQAEWRRKRRELGLPSSGSKTWDSEKKERWRQQYYSRPEVKERQAEEQRRYRNDPGKRYKHLARWAIRRMRRSGKLQSQPCSLCGIEPAQTHHPDYEQPLLVVWLCSKCHRALHRKAEEVLNG